MGKFSDVSSLVNSIFGSAEWQNEGIVTHPSNFTGDVKGNEYIRVSVLTASNRLEYTNLNSMVGQIVIDIFTRAGEGPLRPNQIADILDKYLVGKIFSSQIGTLQMSASLKDQGKTDSANPALFRTLYTINLNYFGK
jgi:hypothetical protein